MHTHMDTEGKTFVFLLMDMWKTSWDSSELHLLDKDGEPLVLEGFGELNVLSALIVDGERSNNHICQTTQQLPHHSIPLLLVTVVHLQK